MSCGGEMKCFTATWEIENFSLFSSSKEDMGSHVWKTETTEDYAWWRFFVKPHTNLDLEFALTRLKREMKENSTKVYEYYKYELSILTSSGEISLRRKLCDDSYCCSFKIEKNKIFGETSDSFLLQGTLTLCCRIWMQKLKPGRCFFRTSLHEVIFSWVIKKFSPDSDSIIQSFHEQEEMLLSLLLYKRPTCEEDSTHRVRLELLPYYGKWPSLIDCCIDCYNDAGDDIRVVSSLGNNGQLWEQRYVYPAVGWEWSIWINIPEENPDGDLYFEFLVAVDMKHPKTVDSAGSPSTLSKDLLQLYKKKTFSDATLNTDKDTSLSAHKNILSARSRVFGAMFERDQTVEGRSGVVDIDDVDSETMDRLLVYLYSDSLDEELRFEQASALYYAADKYDVLPLKQECAQVLMVAMTADNVCDALVLADRHSDDPLMSCAVDFVRHNQEVMSSPTWEILEKSHSRLTTRVLRQVFLQKDKK